MGVSKGCPEFTRQQNIKQIISLDNRTYFDACDVVPPFPNKAKRGGGELFRIEDFPVLVPSQRSEVIEVRKRREVHRGENPG